MTPIYKNSQGYKFKFKAFAVASPIEEMPVCKTCNGTRKKYSSGVGSFLCTDEELNEECPDCFGRGRKSFFAPNIEWSIQVKLQEYLDKLLIEKDEFRKQFLDISLDI